MGRLGRALRHIIAEKGIEPSRVAGYQISALGRPDQITLTVWTKIGISRSGELMVQKHDFVIDSGEAFSATNEAPRLAPAAHPRHLRPHDPARRAVAAGLAIRHKVA